MDFLWWIPASYLAIRENFIGCHILVCGNEQWGVPGDDLFITFLTFGLLVLLVLHAFCYGPITIPIAFCCLTTLARGWSSP